MVGLYIQEMVSSIYYIAGWHLTACLKAGRIRAGKKEDGGLGKMMFLLFECGYAIGTKLSTYR